MGRMQRDKGARGERELAKKLTEIFDVEARRGRQYSGGPGSPDVIVEIDGIHFEVKRTEKLSLYPAIEQSKSDSGEDIPVVAHRRNHKDWLFVCFLEDLPKISKIIYFT